MHRLVEYHSSKRHFQKVSAVTTLELQQPRVAMGDLRNCSSDRDRRFYRPELDLLRFLAFLAVFFHHSLPGFELSNHSGIIRKVLQAETIAKASGSFGVCLFFLLSAYLITELLQQEIQAKGDVHVGSFYRRRILRIWPLYFSFLAVAVVIGVIDPSLRVELNRVLAFTFLSGNWYVARMGCAASPMAPLWSISVEEQFYLAWPWIARLGRFGMLSTCASILPISWMTILLISRSEVHPGRTIWVNSLVQFQFFAIGAMLAICLKGRTPKLRNGMRIAILSAGALVWLVAAGAFHLKDDSSILPWFSSFAGYSAVAVGCTLLFIGILGAPISGSSPVVYLGKISYGLYVFHLAAVQVSWALLSPTHVGVRQTFTLGSLARPVAVQVIALALTIVAAVVSYHLLESPFLRLKERFAIVRSRAV